MRQVGFYQFSNLMCRSEAYLEPSGTSAMEIFLPRSSIFEVQLGHKYALAGVIDFYLYLGIILLKVLLVNGHSI